jgi:hypothetical protein
MAWQQTIDVFIWVDLAIVLVLALLTWQFGDGAKPSRMLRWTFASVAVAALIFVVTVFVELPNPVRAVAANYMVFGPLVAFFVDVRRLSRERRQQSQPPSRLILPPARRTRARPDAPDVAGEK